jgi:DDE family transposase
VVILQLNSSPAPELPRRAPGLKDKSSRARTTQSLEALMLIQEKISGSDTLLKLYVAIDDDLNALQPQLQAKYLPRDPRGGTPMLSTAEVLTILVWGAWRGLTDKAKVYFYVRAQHPQEFPTLGAYSKFVEATNRYSVERRALLALMRYRNRQQQGAYPIVSQDSTAIEVCHMARARQHRTFRDWARKSKNGLGWWYGVKLHVQCNEAGRLCGFDLTTATGDDRKLLDPLTRWMQDGIVVGDGGYLSRAKAKDLAQRGVYLFTSTRKNMRHVARQFPLACLLLHHRVEELFAFLKNAFGGVRTTHRAAYALPIHLLCCLLAYSLYKSLIA